MINATPTRWRFHAFALGFLWKLSWLPARLNSSDLYGQPWRRAWKWKYTHKSIMTRRTRPKKISESHACNSLIKSHRKFPLSIVRARSVLQSHKTHFRFSGQVAPVGTTHHHPKPTTNSISSTLASCESSPIPEVVSKHSPFYFSHLFLLLFHELYMTAVNIYIFCWARCLSWSSSCLSRATESLNSLIKHVAQAR